MVDSSWDGPAPAAPIRRFPAWLPWLLAALLVPIALASLVGGLALGNRSKVWPALRAVAQRLATDEGSLALYRASPDMASRYGSEAAFLEQVRTARPALAALPLSEPQAGSAEYQASADAESLDGQVRLADAHWFGIILVPVGPFNPGGPERVEVLLAPTLKELQALERKPGDLARVARWQAFREVAAALGTEEGTRHLLEGNPELRRQYPAPEDLLVPARKWRQFGLVLPELPKDAMGALHISARNGFGARVEKVYFRNTEGRGLRLVWRGGRLARLTLVVPRPKGTAPAGSYIPNRP